METGEVVERTGTEADLGPGEAVMATGRVSIARHVVPGPPRVPFSTGQLAQLDEALTLASRDTGVDFSVYLGDLGEQPRARAEALHAATGERAEHAVVIAVSPGQRLVELVTGAESGRRIPDRGCKLAVMSMVAFFKEGDIPGGLVSGLRMLADQAGPAPRKPEGPLHH